MNRVTSTTLEAHMRRMLPHARSVPFSDLEEELAVACMDGREDQCVAGAPGGNAGLLILLLSTWERVTGDRLEPGQVDALLGRYLEHFGAFYLHTDRPAQERLAQELRLGALGMGDVDSLVRHPPPALRHELLEALLVPHHVGCGHLALLLRESPSYRLRRALVEDVISAFFRRLWAGDSRLTLGILEGSHEETGVLHIHSLKPGVVPACPRFGELELFVHHPQAVEYLHALHALFLVREGLLPTSRMREFMALQHELGSLHLERTLSQLAPELPAFDVHLSTDPDGRLVLGEVTPRTDAGRSAGRNRKHAREPQTTG